MTFINYLHCKNNRLVKININIPARNYKDTAEEEKLKDMFTRDDAYKTLETINMWINNCDTKTSVVLSGVGVVATIILSSDYARIIKK